MTREGWSKAEEQEIVRLNAQAGELEAKAVRLNELADKKEKLDKIKARIAEVSRR